ncbi:hypothetical protein [Catellatospora paridis]|uniref:hypothetical protein n=1 Tax=Catellatospora paridis TaxID=1617086 RepID=UPI0012D3F396|nr:hypothetical protein [Catellatospora paridis]
MSGLEFVAAMTSALIWPVIVLALVLVFRGTIKNLLAERPTRFQAGPVTAEWDRQAVKVGEGIDLENETPTSRAELRPEARPAEVIELAHSSPLGAIMEKSVEIERELTEKLKSAQVEFRFPSTMRGLADIAARTGLITMGLFSSIVGLSRMRNIAAHGEIDVTPSQAVEFVVLADAVLTELRGTSWFVRGA